MFFIESDFPQQTGTNIINRSSWINVQMVKNTPFLIILVSWKSWIINILIIKKEIIAQ